MNDTPLPEVLKALDFEPGPTPCDSKAHKLSVPMAVWHAHSPCGHGGAFCEWCKAMLDMNIAIQPTRAIHCLYCHQESTVGDIVFEELR